MTAIGTFLGTLYRAELADRIRLGRIDRRSQVGWRTERKRQITAKSSSRWAGAITRTVEDQYQLGMRAVAEYRKPACGGCLIREAMRFAPWCGWRRACRWQSDEASARLSVGRRAVHQVASPRAAADSARRCRAGVGARTPIDCRGWKAVVAESQSPRYDRDDRTRMAAPVGRRADVSYRRRGGGSDWREFNDPCRRDGSATDKDSRGAGRAIW